MQNINKSQLAFMFAAGGLALACSKSSEGNKETGARPAPTSSRSPKSDSPGGDGKDPKSNPKTNPEKPNPTEPSFPASADTFKWIARAGEAGQSFFPPFAEAKRVDATPSYCSDSAFDGSKVLYTVGEVAFCPPGAEYGLSYTYEEPTQRGQKVRSVALVAPSAMGLKAPASATAPWLLVDVVKETSDSGSLWLSVSVRGTHDFARIPTTGSGGQSFVDWNFNLSNFDSDGSVPDDGGGTSLEDILAAPRSAGVDSAGVGGLQLRLSTKGPAGTLEFKLGTQTLILEPQWKTFEEILPASSFGLPGVGTFVRAGVATLTTPPMGTSESELKCPRMAFAPTIWNISGMRKFSYCYGVESLAGTSLRDIPTPREHVSVRYDVAAKDGIGAYSVGLVVDDCSTFIGELGCSITARGPQNTSFSSINTGQTFTYRGLAVTIQQAAGVLASIKVRKPGSATETTFTPHQFPL